MSADPQNLVPVSAPVGVTTDVQQKVVAMLDPVRDAVSAGGEHAVTEKLEHLQRDLALVLFEHEGMATELLRIYEHVSIVFDLTPRLMTVRDENEVISLLARNLQLVFPGDAISVARFARGDESPVPLLVGDRPDQPGGDSPFAPPPWIAHVIEEARSKRKVEIARPNPEVDVTQDANVLAAEQALVAPVFAGEEFVCAMVLWRSAGAAGWDSGQSMLLDSLVRFCGDVIRNFRLLEQLQRMSKDLVRTLIAAVDQKDPYTSGHSNRVGYYALLLGRALALDGSQLRVLEWSALLHDVGKIGIRDSVLKKPGKLTREEFEHIKEHPVRGYDVMGGNPHMRDALGGIRHHHERFDGTGYPDGLAGKQIPLQARIIQIADIFDALTTNRSYRGAYHWKKALEILQEEAGTVVDPDLCATFVLRMQALYQQNPEAFEQIGQAVDELRLTGASEDESCLTLLP